MPCNSCDGMGDAYREDPQARRDILELKEKNDKLTRMLCSLIRTVRKMGGSILDQETEEWFEYHEWWDKSQGR
ncbi:MAG TPA: hypothetical protein VEP90_29390 [Methylomirabilota bacterium]|nr:hypothetical protein [Methylomirabilota bacterium]